MGRGGVRWGCAFHDSIHRYGGVPLPPALTLLDCRLGTRDGSRDAVTGTLSVSASHPLAGALLLLTPWCAAARCDKERTLHQTDHHMHCALGLLLANPFTTKE